jgi:hypothetical protein
MAILYGADFIATRPARGFRKGSQGHPAIRPASDWFLGLPHMDLYGLLMLDNVSLQTNSWQKDRLQRRRRVAGA